MKIYVIGSSKSKFHPLDNIRYKFLVDEEHVGDNIDFLNPWYCELTGLYYMWKHCDADVIGLEHYRRAFVNDKDEPLSEKEISDLLKTNDVICKKFVFKENNRPSIFEWWTRGRNYNKLEHYVNLIDDQKLKQFMFDRIRNQEYYYNCNMFICRKEIMDKYCEFLFGNMSKLPKEFFIHNPRLCGYLAEYTFGFWLQYQGYKIVPIKVKLYAK